MKIIKRGINIREILKYILVIQEVSNKDREPRLGRGFLTAKRLNPYNPLSYVIVVFTIIIAILMFGFYGFWKEVDHENPFKWN